MWITPASGQLRDLRQSIHISNPNFWWHSIRWSLFFLWLRSSCPFEHKRKFSTSFLGPWSFQFGKPLWLQSLYYRLMMLQIHDVCMMFVISWIWTILNIKPHQFLLWINVAWHLGQRPSAEDSPQNLQPTCGFSPAPSYPNCWKKGLTALLKRPHYSG